MTKINLAKYSGFTLIELIIVIVILGILAVTAAPKFINMSSDAKVSSLKGAEASVKAAMTMFHSKTILKGTERNSLAMTLNGVEYWNHWGYPHVMNDASDRPGIIDLAGISASEYTLTYQDVIPNIGNDIVIITTDANANQATCFVSYLQAVDANTPPVINSDYSGC